TPPSPTDTYSLSLHDALPIFGGPPHTDRLDPLQRGEGRGRREGRAPAARPELDHALRPAHLLPVRAAGAGGRPGHGEGLRRPGRSEEHTSELQSRFDLVCRLL